MNPMNGVTMENWKTVPNPGEAEVPDRPGASGAAWNPIPRPGEPRPLTKMDWMTGNPFRSERGVELHPPETVKFYRDFR